MKQFLLLPFFTCLLGIMVSCSYSDSGSGGYEKEAASTQIAQLPATSDADLAEESGRAAAPQEQDLNTYDLNNSSPKDDPTATPNEVVKRKVIRNAELACQVSKYEKVMPQIRATIARIGGRIADENESNEDNRINNTLKIRVNADKFDILLDSLIKHADNINYKKVNSNDITEQYSDLRARLATKKEVEKRYLDLLKQAKTITDIVQIENQARTLREEIDVVEGRLRLFDNQESESTIVLIIYEQLSFSKQTKKSFFQRFFNAIGDGWEGFLEFFISMAEIWPFWLIVTAITLVLRRWWRGRKKTTAAPTKTNTGLPPNIPKE